MTKIIIQFISFILLFLGIWFGISRLNLVDLFGIEENSSKIEKSLGDFYINIITQHEHEIANDDVTLPIKEIINRICSDNGIDAENIKLHIIKSNEVNAFALPDYHMLINTELILFCENPEELAGIIAHEIAHMESDHIMKKLSKEIGFTAISTMIGTGSGGAESLKILSSTAYDRKMEKQADKLAVEYLQNSKINPSSLADFMYRLSTEESTIQKNLVLISTHPETEKRAKEILNLSLKKNIQYIPIFSDSTWSELQEQIKTINEK